jgi:hypothetical protein
MGVLAMIIRIIVAVTAITGSSGSPQVSYVGSREDGAPPPSTRPQAVSFIDSARVGRAAVVAVVCRQRLENPHLSEAGQTVVFKTRVTCDGNLPTILVRVTTLMGRMTRNGMVLVAGTNEQRRIAVTGQPSPPFYTPGLTARKIGISGQYRGQSTLEFTEPGGVKSPPSYFQTRIVPVDAH